uniref:RNA helicase n=1 Tax=Timspurckia oligopyrenoides TaxID=708627 RepID=A0A7S0ZAY7_9RHOD|mmetsp:Transcript_10752/g.19443  ORF Transcript_10752/g.19443 Transcript_10752/m.19443 type:complete len:628 (+) Transcript_10752:63-1946(+)
MKDNWSLAFVGGFSGSLENHSKIVIQKKCAVVCLSSSVKVQSRSHGIPNSSRSTFGASTVAAVPSVEKQSSKPKSVSEGDFALGSTRTVSDERSHGKKVPSMTEFLADNSALVPGFLSVQANGFASLGIGEKLCEALKEQGLIQPSVIQARALVPILSGVSTVVGASTGSGKTLTYLLPVIQALKNEEMTQQMQMKEDSDYSDPSGSWKVRASRRPRVVILAPTRELAQQVFLVAKTLSHYEKCRVVSLVGGDKSLKKQEEALQRSPVDIVISTTGRLLQHIEAANIDLCECKTVVIDEVDTMFDEGFGPELGRIIQRIKRRQESFQKAKGLSVKEDGETGESIQFVAVGATHPTQAEELYAAAFPNAKRINSDLHVVPRGMLQRFVNVSPQEKTSELLALLGNTPKSSLDGGRMIIFANTIDSCRFVDHFLQEHGFTTSCIHGGVPAETRASNFKKFQEHKTQLLVCTDVAARGLDNLAVDHVVMFDFPTTAVDYLHRAGRTARAGRKGIVTSLVSRRDASLANVMEKSARMRSDALVSEKEKRKERHLKQKKDETANRRAAIELKGAPTPGRKNPDPIDTTTRSTRPKSSSFSASKRTGPKPSSFGSSSRRGPSAARSSSRYGRR